MVICENCGKQITEETQIPEKEWDNISDIIKTKGFEALTQNQNHYAMVGMLCKDCFYNS